MQKHRHNFLKKDLDSSYLKDIWVLLGGGRRMVDVQVKYSLWILYLNFRNMEQ